MFSYDVWQWFLFFYIYCFFGWCWETVYVSAKAGSFQNRGFLNGPFLPIYGSGAIVILIAVLPVRNMPVMVFVFGLIAATLLELFTGMAMESLFHVRYWDYSYRKIQYKGHICLVSSIAWGVFSCLMIYGFHKPVERLVLSIPDKAGELVTLILTIIITSDFATSFKTALELKNMLVTADDVKKEIDKLERRAEIVEVFMADSVEKVTGRISDEIKDTISDIQDKITSSREEASAELSKILKERDEKLQILKHHLSENKSVSDMLRRNPSVVSKKYHETLDSYKEKVLINVKDKFRK